MLLKDLLVDDLAMFSNDPSLVASEESIRLLIDIYQKHNKLINPSLVHMDDVPDLLKRLHKIGKPVHTQLIIESCSRSLIQARDPLRDNISVHYTAMDVFCDEEGRLTALLADHYHGKSWGMSGELQQLDLPLLIVVAGGSIYQADHTHCPIFTLQHLLLSAHDKELHATVQTLANSIIDNSGYTLVWLKDHLDHDKENPKKIYLEIVKNTWLKYTVHSLVTNSDTNDEELIKLSGKIRLANLNPAFNTEVNIEQLRACMRDILMHTARKGHTPKHIRLPWFELPPQYNVYMQSITQLNKYVDHVLKKEMKMYRKEPMPTESYILNKARFDVHTGNNIAFYDDSSEVQQKYVNDCKARVMMCPPTERDINDVIKKNKIQFIVKDQSIQAGFLGNDGKYHQTPVEDTEIQAIVRSYSRYSVITDRNHLRQIVAYMRSLNISMKPYNNGIENLTLEYAQQATCLLENNIYTEAELIELCYRERYPGMADLLHSAQEVCNWLNRHRGQNATKLDYSALIGFIFSNQYLLNCFAIGTPESPSERNQKDFAIFLAHRTIIHLILSDRIKIEDLYYTITHNDSIRNTRVVNISILKTCEKNRALLGLLLQKVQDNPSLATNSAIIVELLCSSTAGKLLEIEQVRNLLFSGRISHTLLVSIKPAQLAELDKNPLPAEISDQELVDKLEAMLTVISPSSVTQTSASPAFMAPGFFNRHASVPKPAVVTSIEFRK